MSLYQSLIWLPVHTHDQRPIIWPLLAYFILVCASSLRPLKGERPSYIIHEASSPLIQLLFNHSSGAIFSHVKVTVTTPSASAVAQLPAPPSASNDKWEFQGPEQLEQLILNNQFVKDLRVLIVKARAGIQTCGFIHIFCFSVICVFFVAPRPDYQQGKQETPQGP